MGATLLCILLLLWLVPCGGLKASVDGAEVGHGWHLCVFGLPAGASGRPGGRVGDSVGDWETTGLLVAIGSIQESSAS